MTETENSRVLVTVVVPTRNSASTLGACLASIRAQTYYPIELIIVDNHSEDETAAIARRQGALVSTKGPERSTQRNEGARRSGGKYLLMIDSDMELEPSVINECIEKSRQGYDAVVIPEIARGNSFWALCRALEKQCYIGDDEIESARFFRRDFFFTVGGYDERIKGGGEDWDLHQRIRAAGGRIGRIEDRIVHNEGALRLGHALRKKHYYGKTFPLYRKKHPNLACKQVRLVRPAFIRNWRLLLHRPLLAAGMIFLKAAEFWSAGLGYLASVVRDVPPRTGQ